MAASNLRYVIYDNQDENFVYIEYWIDDDFGLTLSSIQPVPRDVYQAFEDGGGISVRHLQTDEYLIYQRPATQFYRYSPNYDPVGYGWYGYAPFPFIAVQEINFVLRALSAGMLPGPSTSDDLIQGVVNLYMTTFERSKLSGIAAGAEKNVNANWNATFGDAVILNKPEIFLNRYDAEANTARQLADATLTIERYVTVQADGHGENSAAQSNTPSVDNKIVRKIWHKATAFEDSDVTTWTLAHTFADDTAYANTIDTFQALLTAATYGSIPLTLAQTWQDVAVAVGPLDIVPGAAVALSAARRLDSTYTGDAIRVRRASDNAEQDIGFDASGGLDTSALATFCSGTDGFIKTWYDQSGSGNDFIQGVIGVQPKIYDNATGVVLGPNSKPSAEGDGNSYFRIATNFGAQPFTHFAALTRGDVNSVLVDGVGAQRNQILIGATGNSQLYAGTVSAFPAFGAGDHLVTVLFNGGSSFVYDNGTQVAGPVYAGVQGLASGLTFMAEISFALRFVGYLPEYILYPSDQSANRAAIEANINAFYNIY